MWCWHFFSPYSNFPSQLTYVCFDVLAYLAWEWSLFCIYFCHLTFLPGKRGTCTISKIVEESFSVQSKMESINWNLGSGCHLSQNLYYGHCSSQMSVLSFDLLLSFTKRRLVKAAHTSSKNTNSQTANFLLICLNTAVTWLNDIFLYFLDFWVAIELKREK